MAALAYSFHDLSLPQTALPQQEEDPRISDTADTADYLARLHSYIFQSIELLKCSQIRALDSDFAPLNEQLDKLTTFHVGWDGYDAPAPSLQTIKVARNILQRMQEELVRPYWVTASADGGVAFSFVSSGDRRAQVEVLNNGERFAHLYDLSGNSHTEEWAGDLENQPFRVLLEPVLHYMQG